MILSDIKGVIKIKRDFFNKSKFHPKIIKTNDNKKITKIISALVLSVKFYYNFVINIWGYNKSLFMKTTKRQTEVSSRIYDKKTFQHKIFIPPIFSA